MYTRWLYFRVYRLKYLYHTVFENWLIGQQLRLCWLVTHGHTGAVYNLSDDIVRRTILSLHPTEKERTQYRLDLRCSKGERETEKSLSGRYFHLKMIPKGDFRHAEIPRDINNWKMPTSKFGHHFWPKTMEVDCWSKYKYSFKSFQWNLCVRKCHPRHVLGLPRDQAQRKSPEKVKSGWERNRKVFFRALFPLTKWFPKEFFDTPRSRGTKISEKYRLEKFVIFGQKGWT